MCQLPGEGRAEWWVSLCVLRKEESRFGGSRRPASEMRRAPQGFIHTPMQRAGRARDGSLLGSQCSVVSDSTYYKYFG